MKYVTFEELERDDEKYWHNIEHIKPEISCRCEMCGKPILDESKAKSIHLLNLDDCEAFTLEDEEGENEYSQGWFPIGNDCYKKFLKLYNIK